MPYSESLGCKYKIYDKLKVYTGIQKQGFSKKVLFIEESKNQEIQITDALLVQAKIGKVIGIKFKGKRFDCGSVNGYVEATNHYAKKLKIL